MSPRRLSLRARFLLACAALVSAGAIASLWTLATLSRLGETAATMVRDSDATTAATAGMAGALERENDALLLVLARDPRARRTLDYERRETDRVLDRLAALLTGPGEPQMAAQLRRMVRSYRLAADRVAGEEDVTRGLLRYHAEVNPRLRQAAGQVAAVRDRHFQQSQLASALARDEVRRARTLVVAITLVAVVASALVALALARMVVAPLRALEAGAVAIRSGDLDSRVSLAEGDELGNLATAFNEMAEQVAHFRRSDLTEVLRSRRFLEASLEALPDAVLLLEPSGAVITMNTRAWALLCDVGMEEPGPLVDLTPLGLTRERLASAGPAASSAPLDLGSATAVRRGNEVRHILPRVVATASDEPAGQRVVAVLSDVTDLVRLDAMRAELTAVASHELRTPVTTLRMTLLMLRESGAVLPAHVRALVDTAVLGVDQLAGTVDELLDVTQIEAGKLRLNLDLLDVAELGRDAAAAAGERAREEGLSLAVRVAGGLPPVRADATRLRIVVDNLLDNALKYARERVQVEVAAADGVAPRILLSVADDGPGVPAELRERIFEKFFRVEHLRPEAQGQRRGTGIGLYLCRELVALHGGSIRCEEGADGRGARLSIELPALAVT